MKTGSYPLKKTSGSKSKEQQILVIITGVEKTTLPNLRMREKGGFF
jgi:hypothetical protein